MTDTVTVSVTLPKPEVCGALICRAVGEDIWWTHTWDKCPATHLETCQQPKGHATPHSPEVKA